MMTMSNITGSSKRIRIDEQNKDAQSSRIITNPNQNEP